MCLGAGLGKLLVAVVKQGLQIGKCVHSSCGDLHFATNDMHKKTSAPLAPWPRHHYLSKPGGGGGAGGCRIQGPGPAAPPPCPVQHGQWLVCRGCAGCGRMWRLRVRGAQWLAYWGCAGCCGGRLTVFAVHTPPSSGRPQPASLRFRVREPHVPCSSPQEPLHCTRSTAHDFKEEMGGGGGKI